MYSNQQLNQIAKENYDTLTYFCTLLKDDGYWEQARLVLNKPIEEILALYVQALLVGMAVYLRRLEPEEREFIAHIGEKDMLNVADRTDIEQLIKDAEKVMKTPPILFQLFSLRDVEKGKGLTGLFFDGILNIMLCMAYLCHHAEPEITKYLGIYFDKVAAFLQNPVNQNDSVDNKYIFKKLCHGNLFTSVSMLRSANQNFSKYKKEHLYYRKDAMTNVYAAQESKLHRISRENGEHEKAADTIEKEPFQTTVPDTKSQIENDFRISSEDENDSLTQYLAELDALVGLSEVKKEIHSLINLIKVRNLRSRYGLPEMNMSYHMVFTGNPGTGKTTVARLIGKIYRELGIVSGGELIETDRAGLVAGYIGQTALKVKEVVERAIGGVLFIDEAYALTTQAGTNDFGTEAVDTLVKMMEDHRDNLVVIVAGYTDEMQSFIKANTGLSSRFNKRIHFTDYSVKELGEILCGMAETAGFHITEELSGRITAYLSAFSEEEMKAFGNARGIRNLFENLVVSQANRVVLSECPTMEQLTEITEEDFHEKQRQ